MFDFLNIILPLVSFSRRYHVRFGDVRVVYAEGSRKVASSARTVRSPLAHGILRYNTGRETSQSF